MAQNRIIVYQEERRGLCKFDDESNKDKKQSESDLEQELINILKKQNYENPTIKNEEQLKQNLRKQIELLNRHGPRKENFSFTDSEWAWFYREYFEGVDNEGVENRTKKIQGHEFKKILKRDNGSTLNINFINKTNPSLNRLQVINQYTDRVSNTRYDVTILVNGLPLVHIELKRRSGDIKDAFHQIDRYRRCGFSKLFEFIQIFIISNGTETKYYSNTTRPNEKNNNSFLFTSFWSSWNNVPIKDIRDFARTFLNPNTILQILTKYCVFDSEKNLKILRPYQIAAIEGIMSQIHKSIENNTGGLAEGGYVWHTTGSGKTLTSFKAAQLAKQIPEVRKVIFVVDRKDLDHQTTKEYRKFLGESEEQTIDNTNSTNKLRELLESDEDKIIITTIQKLRLLLDKDSSIPKLNPEAFKKRVVIIMDECHRSQTQDIHNLLDYFTHKCVFGFTGTPKFKLDDNDEGKNETEHRFGQMIHSYKIIDAIKDDNVLKFWIDYVGNRQSLEEPTSNSEMESPSRIEAIVKYIIRNFYIKTNPHLLDQDNYEATKKNGFNSILAVKSIDAAIQYYKEFKKQLDGSERDIKVVVIFSASDNEEEEDEDNKKESKEENIHENHKEFLDKAIEDYNKMFNDNIRGFDDYRDCVSKRVKDKEIDILIVVNMFLTGFDARTLNTIWIDKPLEGHNLIQAFSRTNRIYDKTKPHGNIVCFRNLKDKVDKAITRFAAYGADGNSIVQVTSTEERIKEFKEIENKLIEKFPIEQEIIGEEAEKEFVQTWKKYLELSGSLSCEEDFAKHRRLSVAQRQDYSSLYIGIYEKYKKRREQSDDKEPDIFEQENISFDMEILRSEEVGIDYILKLLANYWKIKNRDEILRYVRTSSTLRPEGGIISEYLDVVDQGQKIEYLDFKKNKLNEKIEELIQKEGLKPEGTRKFVNACFNKKSVSFDGTRVKSEIMPDMNFIKEYKEYSEKWKRVQDVILQLVALSSSWSN